MTEQTNLVDTPDPEIRTESRYGRISEADDLDRYYTEQDWPIELLLDELDLDTWGPTVAEPCAGQGDMVETIASHFDDVVAGDLDPASPYPAVDATGSEALERYAGCDCVITNPPYSSDTGTAFEVLDNLLALEVPIALLLRLSFKEPCADREACYRADAGVRRPYYEWTLPRFDYGGPGGGSGNPATSVWYVWRPDLGPPERTIADWWTDEDIEALEGQASLV